ncbi:hypothetical protein ABZ818_35390, partial [Streptomyces sp. NPDC047453]
MSPAGSGSARSANVGATSLDGAGESETARNGKVGALSPYGVPPPPRGTLSDPDPGNSRTGNTGAPSAVGACDSETARNGKVGALSPYGVPPPPRGTLSDPDPGK